MGIVDTGAQISLLPSILADKVDFRPTARGKIIVHQAGIAAQKFEALEARVNIFLEDTSGNRTKEFETTVWFAESNVILLGFDGLLDRAILHLDMPNQSGYIEIPDETLPPPPTQP
jgi:hypothetical protein